VSYCIFIFVNLVFSHFVLIIDVSIL